MRPGLLAILALLFAAPVAAQTPAHQPQDATILRAQAEAHYRNGLAHGERGRFAEAAQELTRAVALNPTHLEAHYYLGGAYAELGRFDQAAAAYQRVLALKPDDVDALYDLGRLYLERKQYPLAWRHARELQRLDPALARELLTTLQRVSAPPPSDR
jgi:tetratricopeptide (TPR) repeat protein